MSHTHKTLTSQQIPFPHLIIDKFMPNSRHISDLISSSDKNKWQLQEGNLHRFWSLTDLSYIASHVRPDLERDYFASALENILDLKLNNQPTIDIFKLEAGDGIGIHDDSEVNAVRIVARISEYSSNVLGGDMILFSDQIQDPVIYDLQQSYGLCFETKRGHFHAISDVISGCAAYLVAQYQIVQQ